MASSKGKQERFIVEIFKVVYKGKEVEPEKQLGTIIAKNRKYHHCIYDVDDPYRCKSSIKDGNELILTGPSLASITCPSGYLVIDVDIFCGAFEESIYVNWIPSYHGEECHYGERSIKSIYDDNDEILIYFGMFYRATEAVVEISLFTTDGSVVEFCGKVAAHTIPKDETKYAEDETKYSSLLFSDMKVQSEEPMPLSRSIVAVPVKSQLSVKIDLSSDDESVQFHNIFNFDPKLDGAVEKTIGGSNCQICAKVTWNGKYHSRGELNDHCNYVE